MSFRHQGVWRVLGLLGVKSFGLLRFWDQGVAVSGLTVEVCEYRSHSFYNYAGDLKTCW